MDFLNDEFEYQGKRTYTLKSSDGQTFQVDKESLRLSKLCTDILPKLDKNETEIILSEVEGKALKKIVDYLNHYKEDEPKEVPRPLKDKNIENILDKWDYEYINCLSMPDCINLINASYYMGILSLVKLACIKVASRMLELPLEKAIETFGIERDMSPEEEDNMLRYDLSE